MAMIAQGIHSHDVLLGHHSAILFLVCEQDKHIDKR